MIRDLLLFGIYSVFVVLGLSTPFVATLGYIWVDTFEPQLISYGLMRSLPVSLAIALIAVGGYIAMDRKSPPRLTITTLLTVLFGVWTIVTTTFAVAPSLAAEKAAWAPKTVLFCAFLPFVFRSRVQIEAFLQVFLFSAAALIIPVGVKNAISGGSYGSSLSLVSGNVGLAEGSFMSAACTAFIPIILYLRQHAILVPKGRLRDLGYFGLVLICVSGALGTFARTALVGFAVVGIQLILRSKRKVLFLVCALVVAGIGYKLTSAGWEERIESTANFEKENSALGRIKVWEWTIQFVQSHPLGGGFNAYAVDQIELPMPEGGTLIRTGVAFHNYFFEILGEQGFPGIAMFLGIVASSVFGLMGVARRTKKSPDLAWAHDLATTLQTSLVTLLACGMFIGIGFQPFLWYMITLPVCLNQFVLRAVRADSAQGAASARSLLVRQPRRGAPGAVGPAGPVRLNRGAPDLGASDNGRLGRR